MKKYYDEIAFDISKSVTQKYSTSFSIGILALKPIIRPAIYAVYGYVRLADEIVDSFHNFDKAALLQRFKENTWIAINERISLNPVLHSFQETVHKYAIDRDLIEQFLHSMEMDLHQVDYDLEQYREYILGSAEVVGLMCLKIFVNGDMEAYEALKPHAMKLGSAFQKVNFLRDLKDDNLILGRNYFPQLQSSAFNDEAKEKIQLEIEEEFKDALIGIKKLPAASKFGVYLAYRYYQSLFKKIAKTSAQNILKKRIRIPNSKKFSLAMSSYLSLKLDLH